MASTLVRIKAQMLLPRPEEDEEEDPRAELVRRLLEYEQIREISSRLSSAEAERSRQFGKGYVERRSRPQPDDVPLETTWEEVWEAALEVEMPLRRRETRHRVATRPVAMKEKEDLILETLERVSRIEFSRLVKPWRERIHGVMTFLAGLELGRRRLVMLRQIRPFSELWLYRNEDGEDGPEGWGDEDGEEATGEPGPENGDDGAGDRDSGAGEGRVGDGAGGPSGGDAWPARDTGTEAHEEGA